MRVLLCTNSLDRGSTSRTLEAWARLLPSRGVHPVVSVGGPGPLYSALSEAGVPTKIRRLRVLPSRSWPFPFLAAAAGLGGSAWTSRAALIHVNEHDNHPVAALAGRLSRVAVVTHLRFRPTREYAAWLFREGRVPSRLFFTSRTQMHDSGEALRPVVPESRWRVLPNGLDFSIFGRDTGARAPLRGTWGLADDVIAIGTACAISKRKRLDHFVRLIARLRQHGVNVHGFVAGQPYFADDTSYLHDLQQLVHDHRIETHLTFLGYVEPAEPLYHAWDLSVSTSSYETFGMAVLESMACACPVVSYPGGAVAEVAGDAASIVPDDDEDALFDECLRLARDPEARQKLGARGRERATLEYDIRTIVPLLVGAYREVAGP